MSTTPRRRWTLEDRSAAFAAYLRTGSRRAVRRELGVPERTLSAWLRDPRRAEEREAVRAGLLNGLREGAAQRGADAAEATREALLVCRKALRNNPNAREAAALLSTVNRVRETEDRLQRLAEDSSPQDLLSEADRRDFEEWRSETLERQSWTDEELKNHLRSSFLRLVDSALGPAGDGELFRRVLERIAGRDATPRLMFTLRSDVPLAEELYRIVGTALGRDGTDTQLAPETRRPPGGPRTLVPTGEFS